MEWDDTQSLISVDCKKIPGQAVPHSKNCDRSEMYKRRHGSLFQIYETTDFASAFFLVGTYIDKEED